MMNVRILTASRIGAGLLVFMLSLANPAAEARGADFYVSPSGNDAWSGKLAEPKADRSDGPVATLDKARRAVADLRKGQTGQRPSMWRSPMESTL